MRPGRKRIKKEEEEREEVEEKEERGSGLIIQLVLARFVVKKSA